MKKLFSILIMFVAINAIATDYVVIRNGGESTVYSLVSGSSGTIYLNEYKMSNPSVETLQNIGLPTNLWSVFNNPDGVYDTRLTECMAQLTAVNAQLDKDTAYIDELSEELTLFRIIGGVCAILSIVFFFIMLDYKGRARR